MTSTRTIGSVLAVMLLVVADARAASINYGNFGPTSTGVTFQNVTESSGTDPVPLYGPPAIFVTGLDFDPIGFTASSTGGPPDITEGQLNFIIRGEGIDSVSVSESGDYTLAGTGTAATQALAGAIMRVTVTAIDGVNVAPIALVPVNASVGFSLFNPGIVQPWSIGLSLNVDAQLTSANIPFTVGATQLDVVIDNNLTTVSEPLSVAFIAKKDFRLEVRPVSAEQAVPEPGTSTLLSIAACGLALRRRR